MDAVEEIKSRLAIEDVIGEYIQLKRAGRNWRGLSPFTNEHTPSFMVSPEKQIWHDFSSGKGGNVFSFIMEMEGLDFKAALEYLARKAGLDMSQFQTTSHTSSVLKERLYGVLDWATKFYQAQFKSNPKAYEYILRERQFTKDTVLNWRLGYAPVSGSALIKFLTGKKYTTSDIKQAGLSVSGRPGPRDMFRGRIMIPLCDSQGRVIGFTARLLEDNDHAPKYINTPQTLLYDKSRHVFGLHLAKEAIRKQGYVVVTEGNMDVIASHQAGIKQVVATAGTALTIPQLKILSRFTQDVRLSFDVDSAGLAATERSIPLASKSGVELGIITVPSGKDPDELIRSSPSSWQKIVDQPQDAVEWLMNHYQKQWDVKTSHGKRQFSDVMIAVIRQLTDPVEQEHYLQQLAGILQVSQEALLSKLLSKTTKASPLKKGTLSPPPAI